MIALLAGLLLIGYTLWNLYREEADPLLFFDYLSGHFDVNRTEHPCIYWTAITIQCIIALGAIGFGAFTLSK